MRALFFIALNGFRESRRNRVTVVVGLFALLLVFFTTFSFELAVNTLDRAMTSVGIGFISLISEVLAIFLACGMLPREVERRTVFLVVSKPVSRTTFLVGRYLGNLATVLFVFSLMTGLFFLQFVVLRGTVTQAHLVALVGIVAEVVLLSAVGLLFSSFSSQFISVTTTVGLFFVGHMASDLYRLASASKAPAVKAVGLALYYLLPNLERLDFKLRATHSLLTPPGELGAALAYAGLYATLLVAVAAWIFERRDFR
ncbi:MAG: hypothetical protein AMXMBFR34_26950 [Myxococcaceae bacterium]